MAEGEISIIWTIVSIETFLYIDNSFKTPTTENCIICTPVIKSLYHLDDNFKLGQQKTVLFGRYFRALTTGASPGGGGKGGHAPQS